MVTDPRLLELDFGRWEGIAWDDVPRAELDSWAADPHRRAPPCGERGEALIERAAAFLGTAQSGALPCAVVTHGGPLRALAALAAGRRVDLRAAAPPFGAVLFA